MKRPSAWAERLGRAPGPSAWAERLGRAHLVVGHHVRITATGNLGEVGFGDRDHALKQSFVPLLAVRPPSIRSLDKARLPGMMRQQFQFSRGVGGELVSQDLSNASMQDLTSSLEQIPRKAPPE
jgi:hypothetical protein